MTDDVSDGAAEVPKVALEVDRRKDLVLAAGDVEDLLLGERALERRVTGFPVVGEDLNTLAGAGTGGTSRVVDKLYTSATMSWRDGGGFETYETISTYRQSAVSTLWK